ncbi:hypothetical protein [Polyangium sp. 15x6]|uniref:hypothetical protein n=1 Tax=Polyangium sp. 15x6 TaxID=3042687 RepID=UPI00249ADD44|nr:hypothetical protein [Polyangium sp. 15x6]MDI3290779.1 hypothetical protein [Polyangium sp. 15x6]
MSVVSEPYVYAYADEADKVDAYVAALSALHTRPPGDKDALPTQHIHISTLGVEEEIYRDPISLEEMIKLIRAHLTPTSEATAHVTVHMHGQDWFANLSVLCEAAGCHSEGFAVQPLTVSHGYTYMFLTEVEVAASHEALPVPVGAAMLARFAQQDIENILRRFCAPDASGRVKAGGVTVRDKDRRMEGFWWNAPLELSATYNVDLHVARDVALSWLHLHDGDRVEYVAGLSLDALAARVEAAPKGTTIGLAPTMKLLIDHLGEDSDASDHEETRGLHAGAIRRVPRARLPEDEELSREQVLAILQTPPEVLLQALEAAAAVPDEQWAEAERRALEALEAAKKAEQKVAIKVDTYAHRCFMERHAPYHVRRLETGGVMIATHCYRHLWPLWSEALRLLGIRP